MKHIFITLFTICLSFTAVQAQEKLTPEKEAAMAKKEADLVEAFKVAQITPEEQVKMREFIKESGEYGKELRADPDFTDEEKILKAKVYAKIKNARMKELLGEAKYKAYRDITNAQKAAKAAAKAPKK